MVNRVTITNTKIDDHSLSWLDTNTLIISCGDKLIL